jgi:hypothetical protein
MNLFVCFKCRTDDPKEVPRNSTTVVVNTRVERVESAVHNPKERRHKTEEKGDSGRQFKFFIIIDCAQLIFVYFSKFTYVY